jgi:heme/copper-type cytochrome/quinol oxidase subunit 2
MRIINTIETANIHTCTNTFQIFWAIIPFLVISVIILFAFAYMYYVQQRDNDDSLYSDQSPNNPYASLVESFKTV